jgi:hypothetical protein
MTKHDQVTGRLETSSQGRSELARVEALSIETLEERVAPSTLSKGPSDPRLVNAK